jgi:hypothetical protein
MILQIFFGLAYGSLSVWLRFSRQIIKIVLQTNKDAIVRLPVADKATMFATMIYAYLFWQEQAISNTSKQVLKYSSTCSC